MRARAVLFPFDLFGSGGCAAGARLLGDALREAVEDTLEETKPVRQHAFAERLAIEEITLDTMEDLSLWQTLAARALTTKDDFLIWLSGNHLGCLPVYHALGNDTLIVQLDAHLDCYDLHDTHATLSHGNMLRQVAEAKARVMNVGHRDLFLTPESICEHFLDAVSAERLAVEEENCLQLLQSRVAGFERVWLDIDADAFDPSICPAVHEPLPFGLRGEQVFRLLNAIDFEKVKGVSISEFDPGRDVRDASLNLLGWLLEWLLLKKFRG